MEYELYHYGILGMKWGIRRFQNLDGSYTEEGKHRRNSFRGHDKILKKENDIYSTLTRKERNWLTSSYGSEVYADKDEHRQYVIYSFVKEYESTPVSFIDIWQSKEDSGAVAVGVRGGKKYRGQGFAKEAVEKGLKWWNSHPELQNLEWYVNPENATSIALAKRYGFSQVESDDPGELLYRKTKGK